MLLLYTLAYCGACRASVALLEVLDSDGNGYLTLEETQNNPQVHFRFSQLDLNRNDRLEVEEMQLADIPPSFSDFDIDQNLAITPQEASALRTLLNQFSQLDKNQDQTLDPDEFSEFSAAP